MKKQAHYTPDTPIKGSAQAAGFLRENLRVLDHEESWILLNGANLPLAKKMITVGTIKSTQIDHHSDHPLPQPPERNSRPERGRHQRDEQAPQGLRHIRYLAPRSHHPHG